MFVCSFNRKKSVFWSAFLGFLKAGPARLVRFEEGVPLYDITKCCLVNTGCKDIPGSAHPVIVWHWTTNKKQKATIATFIECSYPNIHLPRLLLNTCDLDLIILIRYLTKFHRISKSTQCERLRTLIEMVTIIITILDFSQFKRMLLLHTRELYDDFPHFPANNKQAKRFLLRFQKHEKDGFCIIGRPLSPPRSLSGQSWLAIRATDRQFSSGAILDRNTEVSRSHITCYSVSCSQ